MQITQRSLLPVAVAMAAISLLADCKRQQVETSTPTTDPSTSSASATATQDPRAPAASAPAPDTASDGSDQVMKVRAVVAAMPTQYSASFAARRQLQHIAEQRAVAGRQSMGRYEFYGARLVRYSGEKLHGTGSVDLQFDLQGALLGDAAELSTTDIEAIKTRGQLLRSHALAQLAARTHTEH